MKVTPGTRHTAVMETEAVERRLMRNLLSDVATLLGSEDNAENAENTEEANDLAKIVGMGTGHRPEDPALLRLLPDLSADSDERSEEFRRLTEHDIRESKLANIRTALFTLGRTGTIKLNDTETRAWTVALNDVRLVIATRLGLATDSDLEELTERAADLDDATAMTINVYDFLTWTQEQLTTILLHSLPSRQEHGEPDSYEDPHD